MSIIQQHERPLSGVTWQTVEEFPYFDIQRRRLGTLKALHLKHEPQYRLRTKTGKNKYILVQASSYEEVRAYMGALERATRNEDTTNWDTDAWGRVANAINATKQQRKGSRDCSASGERVPCPNPTLQQEDTVTIRVSESPTFPPPPISCASSDDHDSDQRSVISSTTSSNLTGRLLHCLMLHMEKMATLFTWSSPAVTAVAVIVVVGAWCIGLIMELSFLCLLWSLSAIADDVRKVDPEDADIALRKALQWVDCQVACLLEPSSMPLFCRLLLLPTLFFLISQWLFPTGSQLILLLLPFISGGVRTFCPALYIFFDFKTWLLIPHSQGIPCPMSCNARSRSPSPPCTRSNSNIITFDWLRSITPGNGRRLLAVHSALVDRCKPVASQRRYSAPPLSTSPATPTAPWDAMPKTVARMVDLHISKGWELFKADKDTTVDCKLVPWTDTKAFRLTTAFSCSLHTFGTWMCAPESPFKMDQFLEKRMTLEEVNEFTTIFHSTYRSAGFGVPKCDTVMEVTRICFSAEQAQHLGLAPKRTFIEAIRSCEHPSCPSIAGYTRSRISCAGYIVQEEGPQCVTVIHLSTANPEGWTPFKVVDTLGSKFTGKIDKLRQLVETSDISIESA